ncbi:hypothetical protein G3I77_39700 [Streptomyces sp. D2-8]|uniref:hypothetical protein n=1 Tax=Streptomyces sp. D2-8 TaxID=2707767 RepID=UPI0020C12189|nr:hypothetical protein [Streptomyces sp. D2-8]MCK8438889.1 hypothetical protein [Streptomyces sp. D2-8]
MPASGERSGPGGTAVAVGAGLQMVVCCAAPLLAAGGALGVVGGALSHGWLITVGAVILLAGAGCPLRCRVGRRRGAGRMTDARPSRLTSPAAGGREP